jgi:DNA-binding NtrC family response regulator
MTQNAPLAVVDDDEAFRAYATAYLGARGFQALAFRSGEEILIGLANHQAPMVVLLDVSMPGMGGLNTLKAMRERYPDCQVIMLSGQGDAPTIVAALRLGAADYIVKGDGLDSPLDERLDAVLRRALERVDIMAHVAAFRRGVPAEDVHWPHTGRMLSVERLIERVADCDVPVLIRGESGSGKEVVAHAIHTRSLRGRAPFVKINCAALPPELLESELFGHERGAFTGADIRRIGKFEHAANGTILLDEIGEMSPGLQAKLLHVLQDGTFTRLGGNQPISVNARVLAATHRDLRQMIADGQFREDLYYRLRVIEIPVPPLRDRRDELPGMIAHFLARYCARFDRPLPDITDELRMLFAAYHWPGNVRELENTVKRLVLLQDPALTAADLRFRLRRAAPDADAAAEETAHAEANEDVETEQPFELGPLELPPLEQESLPAVARRAVQDAERIVISQTLSRTHWNRKEAAERLGVSYKTLLTKIKELGLDATE